MEAQELWRLFCLTGNPAAYMLYCQTEKESEGPVT